MIPVNKVGFSTLWAINGLLQAERGSTLLLNPEIVATPKTIWEYNGFNINDTVKKETLKYCYVPIMLLDQLEQYCIALVDEKKVSGQIKNKCNLVIAKCKAYLSLISPNFKNHYVDSLLECFNGIDELIKDDLEKFRKLSKQTSVKIYADDKKQETYSYIQVLLLLLNTMFYYIECAKIKADVEMKVIFDIVYDQMLHAFDKNRQLFEDKEYENLNQSVHILSNRIDRYIGIHADYERFKEEAAK